MVNFRLAFPESLSNNATLGDLTQQVAMAGKAFLVSAGLFTADMDAAIGPEVDTGEDYNLITETIRENKDAVFERAATLSEDASASDLMMMQAAFGLMDPNAYGPYLDDYMSDTGFGDYNAEALEGVLSLISRFVSGTIGPSPDRAREEVPAPTQDEYADYFISNVALNDFPEYVREVWELSRTENMGVASAIDKYIADYREEYRDRFEEANGRPMSGRELHQFDDKTLSQFEIRIGEHMNKLSQLEINLRQIPDMEVTPQDIAQGYALDLMMAEESNFHPYSANVYREMLESQVDFETAYQTVLGEFNAQHTGPGNPMESIEARIRQEVASVEEIVEQATIYESIRITPADAMRYMGEAWAERSNMPNPPEHYLQIMEERIAHYQSDAGGNLDQQTASVRAALDARNQVDIDGGTPERAVYAPGLYQHQFDLFEDSIKSDIMVQQGHGLNEEQRAHYQSYAPNPALVDNVTQLEYLTSQTVRPYYSYRSAALNTATEISYTRAYEAAEAGISSPRGPEADAEPDAVPPVPEDSTPQASLSTDSPAFESAASDMRETISTAYYEFMADMPETPSTEQIKISRVAYGLENENITAFNEQNFESFLNSGYELTRFLADNAASPEDTASLNEQAESIQNLAEQAGIDIVTEEETPAAETQTPAPPSDEPSIHRDPDLPGLSPN